MTTCICRSCGKRECVTVLDLGVQPLANNLLGPDDLDKDEPRFPLVLAVCPACWLLQITDTVPPVDLFSDYIYFSSFSDTMLQHARDAATRYIAEFALSPDSLVLEVASNDGYMLRHFRDAAIPCLGIEPAANIARAALEAEIPTIVEFFNWPLADRLAGEGCTADLILGNNVFAHAPDTNDFVAALKTVLKPDGRVVLEFPYALDFLEKNEFDTIYHEHVFYFSLTALQPLFERHDLAIYDVERIPIHGGSLRIFAANRECYPTSQAVIDLRATEATAGVQTLGFYETFAQHVEDLKRDLKSLLARLTAEGANIAAYGASAKGSTLLNYFEIDAGDLLFVADRSTYKQNKLTPGTHIPIRPPEAMLDEQPDYALLLTWNFADEIMDQQREYQQRGGRFIIPIPEVRVV